MIKITYKQIKDPEFLQLVNRIYRSKMAFRSAKRLRDILKTLETEFIKANDIGNALMKEHMEPAELPGTYKPKDGEAHAKALDDYYANFVEIQQPRLTANELFHVELSPSDIDLMEGMIDVG